MMTNQAIILFDGVCNLCNWSVQFILQRDPPGHFKFASMQSEIGRQLMEAHHLSPDKMDTFILLDRTKCYTHSDAALQVAKHLSGGWSMLWGLIIIPKPIRDWGYTLIATNRYRWFGQRETCMLPSPDVMDRFIA